MLCMLPGARVHLQRAVAVLYTIFINFTEESLHHHLRGRRHQDTLDQIATAERSVYVRGFLPHLVQEAELYKLFQPFGDVHKVSLGPLRNKVSLGVWHLDKVL